MENQTLNDIVQKTRKKKYTVKPSTQRLCCSWCGVWLAPPVFCDAKCQRYFDLYKTFPKE